MSRRRRRNGQAAVAAGCDPLALKELLSGQEPRFREIAGPVLIWLSGADKGCTYVNKPWLDFTGRTLKQELGGGWAEGVHPDDLADCLQVYESHFDRRLPFRMEYRLRRADGRYRWILDSGVPRYSAAGDFLGYIGSGIDVTERRESEQALRDSEERLQATIDGLSAQILLLDGDGTIIVGNAAWRRFARANLHEADGAVGQNYLALRGTEEFTAGLYAVIVGERTEFQLEYACDTTSGTRWFHSRVGDIGRASRKHFVVSHEDITKAKRTEAVLRRVRDDERRRIARDLHDSTAQNLLGASLGIDRALRFHHKMPAEARKALDESRKLIEQSQGEIRSTAYLLHPPQLDDTGIATAVRWYAQGFSKRSGVRVAINIAEELETCRFPPDVETALFRVVQEALTNVRRHSGSKKARILLARSADDTVSLTVEDEGRGMPHGAVPLASAADKIRVAGAPHGMGLLGMSERLQQIGGSLQIHARPHGVRITAVLPAKQ